MMAIKRAFTVHIPHENGKITQAHHQALDRSWEGLNESIQMLRENQGKLQDQVADIKETGQKIMSARSGLVDVFA